MFTKFYKIISVLLNDFYPLKTITLSNRDPYFVTPYIKSLLRKRNKLMKQNNIEAANAITNKIGKFIARSNAETFPELGGYDFRHDHQGTLGPGQNGIWFREAETLLP